MSTQAEKICSEIDKATGNLLYHVATKFKETSEKISTVVEYICTKKITSEAQLTGIVSL